MKPVTTLHPATFVLSPESQMIRAKNLARVAHAGARNTKSGEIYILHPERVAAHAVPLTIEAGLSREDFAIVMAACWLHDTVEDTKLTLEMLTILEFDARVIEIVALLTRTDDVDDDEYYARIAAHPLARLCKLADLADNTDPKRMAELDDKTKARLQRKYTKAFRALNAPVPAHVLAA